MSKTGGGRGTNQHHIKGTSQARSPSSGTTSESQATLANLVPQRPQAIQAVTPLPMPDEAELEGLEHFHPGSTDRAVSRLMARRTNLIFNDMALEGMSYTEPEIGDILEGKPPMTTTADDEINQILDLSEATDYVIGLCRSGDFTLGKATSDEVNGLAMRSWIISPGAFRGEGVAQGGGDVNTMGVPFKAPDHGPDGENLRRIYAQGLEEITSRYDHPAAQAAAYAAFGAYNQFYGDGNKRTSRLMMNGHLMSHGYDALVTPVAREVQYNQSLHTLYTETDPAPLMNFFLSLYDDRLPR